MRKVTRSMVLTDEEYGQTNLAPGDLIPEHLDHLVADPHPFVVNEKAKIPTEPEKPNALRVVGGTYEGMSVVQLRSAADSRGLETSGSMKKVDLITLLQENDAAAHAR